MGTAYNANIVTDGLVLCLDAANPRSYPGSGTAWYDLSGRGNHGTLINGPVFSSNDRGSISFDGSNDYINCGNDNSLNMSTEATLIHWLKFNGYNWSPFIGKITDRYVANFRVWIGSDRQFDVELTNTEYKPLFSVSPAELPINSWCNLAVRFKSNGDLSGFFNGSEKNTVTKSIGSINSSNFLIGPDTGGFYGSGAISYIQLYNRALSNDEIRQNFNATRGRYGI